MAISTFPAAGGGGASFKQKIEYITSTSSFTVPADVTEVELILCGGGGSGSLTSGDFAQGGSGSVFFQPSLQVTPGQTYTVSIGGGGASVNSVSVGINGSSSSFGSLFTATGGMGAGRRPENDGGVGSNPDEAGSVGAGLGGSGGGAGFLDEAHVAAAGAFGLGGGGGRGTESDKTPSGATNGGGPGSCGFSFKAEDGKQNSGGGGGGSARIRTNFEGGSGGSGVAIIKYWSAL